VNFYQDFVIKKWPVLKATMVLDNWED